MINNNEVEFCINDCSEFFSISAKSETDDCFKYFIKTDSSEKSVYSADFVKTDLNEHVMYLNKSVSFKMLRIESV